MAALSLALAACGSSNTTGSGGEGGGPKSVPVSTQNDINRTPREALQDGRTFTWPIIQMPTQYNYNNVDGPEVDNAAVINALLPTTFYADATGGLYLNKDLLDAGDVTSSEAKQVVTYKINQKAIWYDGSKISAADFIAQWKALKGLSNTAFKISAATGYEDIETVAAGSDDHTVVVTFTKKYADWKGLFSPLYPASTNNDPKVFNDGWRDKPLTTAGPFKLDKVDRTAKTVTIVRNEKWWGNPAKLDRIVFRQVDADAQIDSLASGEIDYIDIGVNASNYARAKGLPNVTVHRAGGPNFRHITFNGQSEFLKDVNVRRAIAMGIDRAQIARAQLTPLEAPPVPLNNHIYMSNQTGYQDNSGQVGTFDPDAAKAALDAAGWKLTSGQYRQKNGREFDLTIVIPSQVKVSEQEAKQIQSMLAAIGVKLTIQTVPSQDLFDKHITPGKFDLTVFTWQGNAFPISSPKSVYANPKGDQIQQNFARIGSQALDDLFTQATAELDEKKARELGNKIDGMIWDEVHSLTTYQRPENIAVKSNIANFGAFGFANVIYEDIGIAK